MKKPVLISLTIKHGPESQDVYANRRISEYGGEGKVLALEAKCSNRENDIIWQHAERMGMDVVSIESEYARRIIDPWVRREIENSCLLLSDSAIREMHENGTYEDYVRDQKMRKAKYEYIIYDLRTRFMIKRIKRIDPDIIVCGEGHAGAISSEIPVREYIKAGEYTDRIRDSDREVRDRINMMLEERKRKKQERISLKKAAN
jgi:hypothetical protein